MEKQLTCAERIDSNYESRIEDLRALWAADDNETEELGHLYDYGLAIDIVTSEQFDNVERPFIRYQLSWGGPSDELRFYLNSYGKTNCVEYAFMDWFDGATKIVSGNDKEFLMELYNEHIRYCVKDEDVEDALRLHYA